MVDVIQKPSVDLSEFDCIGFASGIYFASFAKPILNFAEKYLPENKKVFFMNTCGVKSPIVYFDAIRKITNAKNCRELGTYQCRGYDTFGTFKLVGGIAKGHPNANEIAGAVRFYQKIEGFKEIMNNSTQILPIGDVFYNEKQLVFHYKTKGGK